MPELPEVETIANDLRKSLVGERITSADFLWKNTLKNSSAQEFERKIYGKKIQSISRRAKTIIIGLGEDTNLIFHMKMTGHLLLEPKDKEIDKNGNWAEKSGPLADSYNQYIRALFRLSSGKILAFSDLRKFGYVKIANAQELENLMADYGPEPFSGGFSQKYLESVFAKKNIAIKKVLMDQKIIAGIGNIYADEILWTVKIHPLKKANELSSEEISDIIGTTKKILTKSIKERGTSTSDFRDTKGRKGNFGNFLNVYRRTGLPCPRDKEPIKRIVVGGRGTHFCPKCQKVVEGR